MKSKTLRSDDDEETTGIIRLQLGTVNLKILSNIGSDWTHSIVSIPVCVHIGRHLLHQLI